MFVPLLLDRNEQEVVTTAVEVSSLEDDNMAVIDNIFVSIQSFALRLMLILQLTILHLPIVSNSFEQQHYSRSLETVRDHRLHTVILSTSEYGH